jgi:aryl-alcohol dehydrogenase-like predicted oxidoreductase
MVYMNDSIYAYHAATRLPVAAYASQAGGFFAPHKRGDSSLASIYGTPRNEARRAQVDALADRRGATQNQIALAWLWHHPFPVIPIVGPRTLAQLRDSLGATGLRLSPGEITTLMSLPE